MADDTEPRERKIIVTSDHDPTDRSILDPTLEPRAPSEEALAAAHAFMRESFGCQEVFCTFARGCGCAQRLADYAARAVAAERERCLRIIREEFAEEFAAIAKAKASVVRDFFASLTAVIRRGER